MNLDALSDNRREQYDAVTRVLKSNPEMTYAQAEKEAGVPRNSYFYIRRIIEGNKYVKPSTKTETKPKTKKHKMITLPVEGPITSDNIVAFVGNTRSVVEAIREYQR